MQHATDEYRSHESIGIDSDVKQCITARNEHTEPDDANDDPDRAGESGPRREGLRQALLDLVDHRKQGERHPDEIDDDADHGDNRQARECATGHDDNTADEERQGALGLDLGGIDHAGAQHRRP